LTTTDLDTLSINTIRGLAMDEVQKANSGHPGTPMGIAPVAYTLWQRFLSFDPSDPIWPNRDRFVILMATGSEVQLALEGRDELEADGIAARVVSMPCWELFDRQPPEYRDQVLPRDVRARVAIEQASTLGWDRYVGDGGAVIGMLTFGASAPLKQLLTNFGFTPEHLSQVARELVAAAREQAAS
jgi:transketolase